MQLNIGAQYIRPNECRFRVWAPQKSSVSLVMVSPVQRSIPMHRDTDDCWELTAENVPAGTRYLYDIDGSVSRPDPASRFQPEGVHGASEVVDPAAFSWDDEGWKGMPIRDFIIYEIHVGTFTADGTFEAIIPHLDYLKDLGITAIELMPVAQFPGRRNWGYDGVYLFAPQNSYGGPAGLKALVNACHMRRVAVILDVVYNHLGPEGNYLGSFGPYFTERYKTPWGDAINFDGPYSDGVRDFFIQNALYWITDYHIDALRLDAVHGIFDFSANPFLRELAAAVHGQADAHERKIHVIAESELNDSGVIRDSDKGGYGLDALWNDDFHHAVHSLISGEKDGYYEDFGRLGHLEKAFREGFTYSGQYSGFRKRRHGNTSADIPVHRFIVFSQNHDQVGNRMHGDRPNRTQSFDKLKLAAAVVILSPYLPLLFMGEEYGETAPFQYFINHQDKDLIEAVRNGRKKEFAAFSGDGDMPDPEAEETFLKSKINMDLRNVGNNRFLFALYKELIILRKELPALSRSGRRDMDVKCFREDVLFIHRRHTSGNVFCLYNFSGSGQRMKVQLPEGDWLMTLDSSDEQWGGTAPPGALRKQLCQSGDMVHIRPHSALIYRQGADKRRDTGE